MDNNNGQFKIYGQFAEPMAPVALSEQAQQVAETPQVAVLQEVSGANGEIERTTYEEIRDIQVDLEMKRSFGNKDMLKKFTRSQR